MNYTKLERELAAFYGFTPEQVRGCITAFQSIDRLSFVGSVKELNRVHISKNGGIYPLPAKLYEAAFKYLSAGKRTAFFFAPAMLEKNIWKFIESLIKTNTQPKEFFFDGVLCIKKEGDRNYDEVSCGEAA